MSKNCWVSVMVVCGIGIRLAYGVAPETQPGTGTATQAATQAATQVGKNVKEPLPIEIFEEKLLTLAETDALELEAFIQDLNRQKDADYALMGGQPGPKSERLWKWIDAATKELESRGYYKDDQGAFHRPDKTIMLWR